MTLSSVILFLLNGFKILHFCILFYVIHNYFMHSKRDSNELLNGEVDSYIHKKELDTELIEKAYTC